MNKWDYLFIFSWALALGMALFTLTKLWYAEQYIIQLQTQPTECYGPGVMGILQEN